MRGTSPLNDVELLTWMNRHESTRRLMGGIHALDTLPLSVHYYKPTLFIVNTAKSSHPGKHWVCILLGLGTSEFFDSLGTLPCKTFVDFMGPQYKYCTTRLQSLDIPSCGYYTLFYALCRSQGLSFESIVHNMSLAHDNDIVTTVRNIVPS